LQILNLTNNSFHQQVSFISKAVHGFNMPLKVKIDDQEQWIHPTTNWTYEYTKNTKKELIIDPNFYAVGFKNMNNK